MAATGTAARAGLSASGWPRGASATQKYQCEIETGGTSGKDLGFLGLAPGSQRLPPGKQHLTTHSLPAKPSNKTTTHDSSHMRGSTHAHAHRPYGSRVVKTLHKLSASLPSNLAKSGGLISPQPLRLMNTKEQTRERCPRDPEERGTRDSERGGSRAPRAPPSSPVTLRLRSPCLCAALRSTLRGRRLARPAVVRSPCPLHLATGRTTGRWLR